MKNPPLLAKIKLGMLCRDRVTRFEGVAVARHEYLEGCTRYSLQPQVGDDGKVPDIASFDEPSLEPLEVVYTPQVAPSSEQPWHQKLFRSGGPDKYADDRRQTDKGR